MISNDLKYFNYLFFMNNLSWWYRVWKRITSRLLIHTPRRMWTNYPHPERERSKAYRKYPCIFSVCHPAIVCLHWTVRLSSR